MESFPINYVALLVAALAKFVIGSVWFTALGRQWRKMAGIPEGGSMKGLPKAMVIDLIGNFVMAFVLVHAVHYAGAKSLGQGAAVGFFNWLGFIAVVTLTTSVYEGKPFKLFLFNNVYLAVSLATMGAILAVWV
jgi:Protein of unknown function (DUF1761)